MSKVQPEEPVSPTPESARQDGDAPLPFEQRYRLPPGARVVTTKPGEIITVIGAGGMKPYLTRDGKVFIVPNYSIRTPDSKGEWSCPDFVALDFGKHHVVVVEATTGTNADKVIANARDREKQWFEPLRAQLNKDNIADGWPIRFLGFVRRTNIEKARKALDGAADVTFVAVEDATFPWDYWEHREKGLPR
jgi:hypothetical protein